MGNFAENLNLGNRFRPPPVIYCYSLYALYGFLENCLNMIFKQF